MNIILDLDHTCIQSLLLSKHLTNNIPSSLKNLKYEDIYLQTYNHVYRVFQRPYLQTFLDYIFEHFNVGVLSYGKHVYVHHIVKTFILNPDLTPTSKYRRCQFIYSKNSFEDSSHKNGYLGMKNLDYIFNHVRPFQFYKCNTLIIDDTKSVINNNTLNALYIPPWTIAKIKENEGKEYIKYYEKENNDTKLICLLNVLKYLETEFSQNDCTENTLFSGCNIHQIPLLNNLDLNTIPDIHEDMENLLEP